jgi:hypothetical protein
METNALKELFIFIEGYNNLYSTKQNLKMVDDGCRLKQWHSQARLEKATTT